MRKTSSISTSCSTTFPLNQCLKIHYNMTPTQVSDYMSLPKRSNIKKAEQRTGRVERLKAANNDLIFLRKYQYWYRLGTKNASVTISETAYYCFPQLEATFWKVRSSDEQNWGGQAMQSRRKLVKMRKYDPTTVKLFPDNSKWYRNWNLVSLLSAHALQKVLGTVLWDPIEITP